MIVRILPEAEADLESIADYIARDNPRRALSFLMELRTACESLVDMAQAFPIVPRYARFGVRHRVYGSYQIFYRIVVDEERIDIIHVIHGARSVDLFEDI
ncbi:type II toxin-antitoxin system RelE/ParE family toxin [Microvirga sp. W0021]|uniref:Type II toxin-antitoxin system RelE/ParE family toxin n=2 Tax=Hohaiivirga grylli TaxID=3133970 RepID=A0ABV0BNG4_9HYPH